MAKISTYDELKRAIFDAVATYHPRPGEIVPLHNGIWPKLHSLGHRPAEVQDALERMVADGLVTTSGKFLKLTEEGFAEM